MALCEPSSSNSSATGKGLHPLIDAPLECTTEAAEMPMQLQRFLSFGSSLIVDDCPMMQWLTQAMFEEWGATAVTVASDGQEAVNILCQAAGHERSWLVIMDVQMPVLDGFEATRVIRDWERSQRIQPRDALVIIGVSGDGDEDACGSSAIDAGMDAMLSKPVKHDELLHCLNEVAAARHAVEFAA
uniref:Response regulatory domain-containing protein n=1 Tax=Chrysotila carterae TaxID=13221 RepID=A0A7S4B830_CHRCT|mmetsp:Transcript_20999/g.44303  ORF Transcript_20999/g.44303 Transcript_20999/m.44303 type:complete len:186 (+) Transcript_20999:117-674(+)